jgi:SIT family siderophore-iron:H+ symporter-like MFS transporter
MSTDKQPHLHEAVQTHDPQQDSDSVIESPGVKRIEAISSQLGFVARFFLFFGIFLVAYVYGLDGQLRGTYQVCNRNNYEFSIKD